MSANPEMIKQVQTKLNEAGHDVGAVDGIIGPKTQKGLKEFQTSKGLKASGELDQQTLSALGVSGSAAGGGSAAKSEKKAEGSAASGASAPAEKKAESKSEGSAGAGATTGSSSGSAGGASGSASGSTTEQKPQQPPAPAKTEKPGEKKY